MRRAAAVSLCLLAAFSMLPREARAWHSGGHGLSTRAAVAALPPDLPAFFREAADVLAGYSVVPDTMRNRATPQLTAREVPEHFFDLELLQGRELPRERNDFIALCHELGVKPNVVGFLPYSIAEWTQALTVAFAEHRRRPDDAAIRAQCLLFAGILAHYAGDAEMPLHTTIHFDGRMGEGFKSPRTGIHDKVDELPTALALRFEDLSVAREAVRAFKAVLPEVWDEIGRSHKLVDRVYELEPLIRGDAKSEEVRAFTKERMEAAAAFIASLYVTAWQDSAKVDLPEWLGKFREGP